MRHRSEAWRDKGVEPSSWAESRHRANDTEPPYWRSSARCVVCGLTRYANKAHIARAVPGREGNFRLGLRAHPGAGTIAGSGPGGGDRESRAHRMTSYS